MSHPADSVLLAPPNIRLFQCLFAGLLFCLLHKSLAFFFVLYPGPFPRQMALKSRQIVIQLRLFCLKAKPESIPIFSLLSPSFPINIAQTLFKPMLFKLWKQEREQNGEWEMPLQLHLHLHLHLKLHLYLHLHFHLHLHLHDMEVHISLVML